MNITIINGIPNDEYKEYEAALEKLKEALEKTHTVDLFNIRNMKISYCSGCFGCWTNTPGLCIYKDDMSSILRSMSKTDYTIYLSPLKAGFITSQTKKVMDRFIPSALPYIKIFDRECHHPMRYDNKQKLGLVILNDNNFEKEAYDLTVNVFDRFSRNMHATKFFNAYVRADEMEVILNEINNC
jgi:multimeric flavodoxin WrbA